MGQNILITGAAGYIGGTILADFLSRSEGPIASAKVFAAVRKYEQVAALSKLGATVIQVDLGDEKAVHEMVVGHEIDIILHLASAMQPHLARYLIQGLGHRHRVNQAETSFVHSGVTALFAPENGWPNGTAKDEGPTLFEEEKLLQEVQPNPVREANICAVEQAEKEGVSSYIVVVPTVYGRGSGEWRKLSSMIPSFIRSGIKEKIVHRFDKEGQLAMSHVSDLAVLYGLLTENILLKKPMPNGRSGYYLAVAHQTSAWTILENLAQAMHKRELIVKTEPQLWSSDEAAAKSLGFPPQFARAMGTATGTFVTENATHIGWSPRWNQDRLIDSLNDEIEDVQSLDTVKTTIYDALMP